jgi:hypothetical protein
MPDNLREYKDRAKLDPTMWLGQAIAFRVAEACLISHDDLRKQLKAIGLEQFTPRAPKDEDVFRRVASGHARKRVPTATAGIFENYLIRDVSRGGGRCTKQIVVEVVDGTNKRLDYAPVVQLDFDGGLVSHHRILPTGSRVDSTQAENLAELIAADYAAERGQLNSYAVREMLRRVLADCMAVPFLTGGGLYFVSPVWTNRITEVEGMKVPGMEMHSFPILDDTKQREMLRKSIEAETNEAMDKMLGEIETMLDGPEIPESTFRAMVERRSETKTKAKDYADMLDETLDNTNFRMQMVDAAMRKLLDHVKV